MAKLPPKKTGATQSGNAAVNPLQKPVAPGSKDQPGAAGSGFAPTVSSKVRSGIDVQTLKKQERPEPPPSSRIEEKVFAVSALSQISENPIFLGFMRKVAPKIWLPDTSYGFLESFSNIDVTAEKLGSILKRNPYYEFQFLNYIESVSRREEMPSIEAAVVLLGMQNTRNLILGLQLNRLLKGGHPEWTKEQKLKTPPSETLKYALKVEEALAGKRNQYADTAFSAAVLIDLLHLIGTDLVDDKKRFQNFVDINFTTGMRAAFLAEEIAKTLPEFGFKKYLFGGALIHDCGRLVMAMLDKTYIDFVEKCNEKEVPPALRLYLENKKYGITHAILGMFCCEYFKLFAVVERAVLYHHEPYMLKTKSKNLYQLASLLCLASNIANHFKKIDKKDDPVVGTWKGLELSDFPVDMKNVIKATNVVPG